MKIGNSHIFYVDPELHLVHTERNCPEAKMAVKYCYIYSVTVRNVEDAQELDDIAKPCIRCLKREYGYRQHKANYVPPPGFRRYTPK